MPLCVTEVSKLLASIGSRLTLPKLYLATLKQFLVPVPFSTLCMLSIASILFLSFQWLWPGLFLLYIGTYLYWGWNGHGRKSRAAKRRYGICAVSSDRYN